MLAALAALTLTVPLVGGSLLHLRDPGLRRVWLLYAALAVQLLITVVATTALSVGTGKALHLASYALAFAWVAANRHLVGLWVAAIGGAMNLAAIVANGGQMPAAPGALRLAGMAEASEHFVNSGAVDGARLQVLGDVFAVPASWPLSNVFSVGDVLLVVGGALIVHHLAGSPWLLRWEGLDLAAARRRGGPVRRWAPLTLTVVLALATARTLEHAALGVVAALVVLAADPRGPEVPVGRWLARRTPPPKHAPRHARPVPRHASR